jgi:hypothetical protein
MSENITFNLPITISRERFDAIVKEAARKIYTDGLFDPTDALSPAVAEAVQKQMGAPQATPPGVIQAGAEPSLRPGPAQADKGSGHGDPDRPIPPYAWGHLHAYVRARSVPTAALLAQRVSIDRWTSDGIVVFKMAEPFAKQFETQQVKRELLGLAVKSVFGPDARWAVFYDTSSPLPLDAPPIKAPVDTDFLKLVDLINSSEWVYYEGSPRMRDAAVLWGPEVRRGGSNLIPSVGAICYMLPRYPGVLFLAHLNKQVRDILGRDAGHTLRGWLSKGLLMQCRTNAIDKVVRYSQNASVLGEAVTLSRINIAKLEELGISVNLFQFP